MKEISLINMIGFSGLVDILFTTVLIYLILLWFKKKRAAVVLSGIIIIGLIYLIAHQFNLFLISSVLRGFFAVFLIAIIIIFQEELKYFFEQVAVWSFKKKLLRGKKGLVASPSHAVEILVRTVTDLAKERIGALIVLKGTGTLMRHLEGGTDLNGELSEAVLKSIFDPHSMGHDGAVLIDGDLIVQFGAHLPLSKDFKKLKGSGTRHAAALGLAELTNALCLVVSEEKGKISIAANGEIFEVKDVEELTRKLTLFTKEASPQPRQSSLKDFFVKNYREKTVALILTFTLWFVLVYESKLVRRTYQVEIEYPSLKSEALEAQLEPSSVSVIFSGPRNSFHFINPKDIRLSLKLLPEREGVSTIILSNSHITFPKELNFERIEPNRVKISIVNRRES